MTLVGYKRMTIQILDNDLKPVSGKQFVVEGKANEGATDKFQITGLAKEAVKTYGSNIPYFVSQKGTGDVKANFGILDLPFEATQEILGRKKSSTGVYHIGEGTEAPYCAVLCESADMRGQKIGFGLYAGKFAQDAVSAETLTDGDFTPSPDDFTFVPITKVIEGENQTVGIAGDNASFTALSVDLFGSVGAGTEGGD